MLILYDATIDCPREQRDVYEWAYGDFETDDEGKRILDDDKLPIPINPIRFPLRGTTIIHNGSRTIISIPRGGGADFRIDELSKSAEPKRASKGAKDVYNLGGISDRLLRQNIELDTAHVTFTVTNWRAEHLPNQKLEILPETDE